MKCIFACILALLGIGEKSDKHAPETLSDCCHSPQKVVQQCISQSLLNKEECRSNPDETKALSPKFVATIEAWRQEVCQEKLKLDTLGQRLEPAVPQVVVWPAPENKPEQKAAEDGKYKDWPDELIGLRSVPIPAPKKARITTSLAWQALQQSCTLPNK